MTDSKSDFPFALCPRVAKSLPIQGRVDDAPWASIKALKAPFQVLNTKQPVRRATGVRVAWDKRDLYLGFHCETPDVAAISTQRDSPLFREECVEFFLRVPGREDYWEFQGNSVSVIYDAYVPRYDARRLWQRWCRWNAKDVRYRASVQSGSGWQATWALSWRDIGIAAPAGGQEFEIKLCRVADDQFLAEQELSCWPPSDKAFDEPGSWATLRLSEVSDDHPRRGNQRSFLS